MLTVEKLQKTYLSRSGPVEAIRAISLSVAPGEFVSIVGPSGAGKTTLLRCLAGLLEPSGGTVTLDGRLVTSPPAEMACVFQDYTRSLMPWMSVVRNVTLPLKNKVHSPRERRARADAALREVGLDGFANHYPWQLSGGMQQRVAIARGIAYRPEILLMDEPFASVDAQTRADLEDLILRVREDTNVTVLLVTHDIDEAVYLADRVVVLSARPTEVAETFGVPLGRARDQLATKSRPEFIDLRGQVLKLIRGGAEGPEHLAVVHRELGI